MSTDALAKLGVTVECSIMECSLTIRILGSDFSKTRALQKEVGNFAKVTSGGDVQRRLSPDVQLRQTVASLTQTVQESAHVLTCVHSVHTHTHANA